MRKEETENRRENEEKGKERQKSIVGDQGNQCSAGVITELLDYADDEGGNGVALLETIGPEYRSLDEVHHPVLPSASTRQHGFWFVAPLTSIVKTWFIRMEESRPVRSFRRRDGMMPQGAWSEKRERQYDHIKEGLLERGDPEDLAEEIAARTVNKERARSGEAEQRSRVSTDDVSPGRRGGLRSHRGSGGRTRDQLYEEARRRGIRGGSKMSKAQLQEAVDV